MGIVTFGHDGLILPTSLAASALTQLNLLSVFSMAATGGYGEGAYAYGANVQFRRIQISDAQKYNPRSNVPAPVQDIGFVTGILNLSDLYTAGVPLYSSDYGAEKYIKEAGAAIAFSITKGFDVDLYNRFRTPTHASVGAVQYGVNMPLRIVANESSGTFTPFTQNLLIRGGAGLDEEDTAPGERYAIISNSAKADYLGSQTPVDAGTVYDRLGLANLVRDGMPIGRFIERMGFNLASSNVIGRNGIQQASFDLDTAAGTQGSLPISAATDDVTFFFKADYATSTALGAVVLTLTSTGLQGLAVGQIARIADGSNVSIAYGVVLRVDPVAKQVYLVPFTPNGRQLSASAVVGGATLSVPLIPSVSVGYKKSALIYDTRQMEAPPEGAGATMVGAKDDLSGLMLQIWQGGYDINSFKSSMRYSLLSGSTFNDYRCGCFMLSA